MDDEAKKLELGEDRYKVLRQSATEAPYSGALLDNKKDGMYHCGYCGEALFSSDHKFDSGSGWPSFDRATDKVKLETDSSLGMVRTEVKCANCDSHLGHMFDDGPADTTGQRFCINSASLDFEEKNDSDS